MITCSQTCGAPEATPLVRRTMTLPRLHAGDPCPVSTTYQSVSPDVGAAFGDGPVRIVGVGAEGTFGYVSFARADVGPNPYWGGQKVLVISAPGAGPALLRGFQLDGGAALGFGDAPFNELHRPANPDPDHWAFEATYLRIQHPGCYGLQVDTPTGTTTIVFRASGPVLDPPASAPGARGVVSVPIHFFCLQEPLAGRIGFTAAQPRTPPATGFAELGDEVADITGLPPATFVLLRFMDATTSPPRIVTEASIRSDATGRFTASGEGPTFIKPDTTVTEIGVFEGVPNTPVGDPNGVERPLGPPAYPC